jgi:sulfur carrier protein ThiS
MDGMVRVTILPDRQVQEVDATTVSDVLTALGLHRDAHLVVRGEDILTSDTRLTETDELEIVPVISGGGQGGPPPSNGGRV